MSDEFVWEDPPVTERASGRREAMKANPGKWMVWGDFSSAGALGLLKKAGFHCTTRVTRGADGKKRYRLYARWPEDVPNEEERA